MEEYQQLTPESFKKRYVTLVQQLSLMLLQVRQWLYLCLPKQACAVTDLQQLLLSLLRCLDMAVLSLCGT